MGTITCLLFCLISVTVVLGGLVSRDHGDNPYTEIIDKAINAVDMIYSKTMCVSISKFDCDDHVTHGSEIICGYDHNLYPNKCVFAKARCIPGISLTRYSNGPCPGTVTHQIHVTTLQPTPNTWGHDPAFDVIRDVFCDNMNAIHCGNNVDADICSNDGRIYQNQCLFAKVKCFKPDLEVADPAICREHRLPIHSSPLLIG